MLKRALGHKDKHLLLVETEVEEITRALLVKPMKQKEETLTVLLCLFVGPVYFRVPLETKDCIKANVIIGDISGMEDIEMRAWQYLRYWLKVAGTASRKEQAAKPKYAVLPGRQTPPIKTVDSNTPGSNGSIKLLSAAEEGDEQAVQRQLESGVSPDVQDKYGRPALHRAAWRSRKNVVKLLLDNDAKPHALDGLGQSALHLGAERGDLELVKLLLEVSDLNIKGEDGKTALHYAAWGGSTAVVRRLLDGIEPNTKDTQYKRAAIHIAAEMEHLSVVRLLLEKRTDPDIRDSMGQTPLHVAAGKGYALVVGLLLEREPTLTFQTQ